MEARVLLQEYLEVGCCKSQLVVVHEQSGVFGDSVPGDGGHAVSDRVCVANLLRHQALSTCREYRIRFSMNAT